MAADTTALAEGRRLPERDPQLRSHLQAVAESRTTHRRSQRTSPS
jgi:hypothetical protein